MRTRHLYKTFIKNLSARTLSSGLTFIELIVVISIFSIIASIVLFNFSTFSTNITSQNLAQQIALQIKEAQSNSISGKISSKIFSDGVPSYGVYIGGSLAGAAISEDHFVYFADLDGDGQYFPSVARDCKGECLSDISINTTDRITGLCADSECLNNIYSTDPGMSLTFKRPFPDAKIYLPGDPTAHSVAGIRVTSVKGNSQLITVTSLGQISVKTLGAN